MINLPYLGYSLLIIVLTTIGLVIHQISPTVGIIFYVIGGHELIYRIVEVIKKNEPKISQEDMMSLLSMFNQFNDAVTDDATDD